MKTKTKHETLKQAAIKAIQELGGDMSVGHDTTMASLRELEDEITIRIEALRDDGVLGE